MSIDATIWAWKIKFHTQKGKALPALKKLILLSMADRADENHCCFPSVQRLADDCHMDRKTVLKILNELVEDGLIGDTGKRTGRTNQVIIYQLIGVLGREKTVPVLVPIKSKSKNTNNGTVPTVEQFQQSTVTVPTIPTNSPNVGTRNLSKNLSIESKNKKHWLCSKKLSDEIAQANAEINPNEIISASWFNREFRSFEKFNEDRNHSDEAMVRFFADWMLKARAKYAKMKTPVQRFSENKTSGQQTQFDNHTPDVITFASDKQLYAFAKQMVFHPAFKDSFCLSGESWMDAAKRMAALISDPEQQKPFIPLLIELGFKQTKGAAA